MKSKQGKSLLLLLIIAVTIGLLLKMFFWGPILFTEQDKKALNSHISIIFNNGALHDPSGKAGTACMMTELLLRGTKNKTRSQYQEELELIGGTFGSSCHYERISFEGVVIRENTEELVKLMKEALIEPAFSEEEFQKLKKEVLANIKQMKNSNLRLAGKAMRKVAYNNTLLSRSYSGSLSSVESITLQDIKKSYQELVHRSSMITASATSFKKSAIKKMITPLWKDLPKGRKKPQPIFDFAPPHKTQIILIDKAETSTGSLILGIPGINIKNPDLHTLNVGNFGFGSEPSVSTLFKVIRSANGWTYSVGATYEGAGGHNFQKGLFMMYSTPSQEFTVQTMYKKIELWREYLKNGISAEDLAIAKESMINSFPFEISTAAQRVSRRMGSSLYQVPLLNETRYEKKINAITNEDIIQALKKNHPSPHWWITLVADKSQIEAQLEAYNANIPEDQRITISKVLTPEELIE